MKTKKMFVLVTGILFCLPILVFAQSNFSVENYQQFLADNKNMESSELLSQFAPKNSYYKEIDNGFVVDQFSFLNSIISQYHLTEAELDLLKKHQFIVSERLSYDCFANALIDIYNKDLPVFVTTDAILHALHFSYDGLLMGIEAEILRYKLLKFVEALYSSFPQLVNKYQSNEKLGTALSDVDLYVTIAKSLFQNEKLSPQYGSSIQVDAFWNAIKTEQLVEMELFTKPGRVRRLDFSQFTVRGHYSADYDGQTRPLENYFKCMMWLGRMDFWLTPPPENPWEEPWGREEIRRMNLGALLLHELVDMTGFRSTLNEMDEIITFMVGESDNLTPTELSELLNEQSITSAVDLLDDATYDSFQAALKASANSAQKILSNFLLVDPNSSEPSELPVSFRLFGQRFIIDSYIFFNVVYDRIIFNDQKMPRPMPDPLDAMFVLGNDDALPLLKTELDRYNYSSQLGALRYLVDAYDEEFWDNSLYNVWLNAIRCVNPPEDKTNLPLFMQTVAWHQQKLNTQLSSWTQLRHDNLLYAKQSYTGAGQCSFPHGYVEPYPDFYKQIKQFAEKGEVFFSELNMRENVIEYFQKLKEVMSKLEEIAQKELDCHTFNEEEAQFLKNMLYDNSHRMCGQPPVYGWYADLLYDPLNGSGFDALETDYLVADVHTQPTEVPVGPVVGRVLHVGVGKINLGIFLADSPSDNFQPMAYVGPVMSYYEKITEDFDRLTDERWTTLVKTGNLPPRPDWVNIYLADKTGNAYLQGRELPGVLYTTVPGKSEKVPEKYYLSQNFPNPFNPQTTIEFSLPTTANVTLKIYNAMGQEQVTLLSEKRNAGKYKYVWDANEFVSGVYFYQLVAYSAKATKKNFVETKKLILLK